MRARLQGLTSGLSSANSRRRYSRISGDSASVPKFVRMANHPGKRTQGVSRRLLRRDDHGQRVRVTSDRCALDLIIRNADLNRRGITATAGRTRRVANESGHRASIHDRREPVVTIVPLNDVARSRVTMMGREENRIEERWVARFLSARWRGGVAIWEFLWTSQMTPMNWVESTMSRGVDVDQAS